MAELSRALPAFGSALKGAASAAVSIEERDQYAIAAIHVRKGMEQALASRFAESFGFALPAGPSRAGNKGVFCVGNGPGKWLVMREGGHDEWAEQVARDLAGVASVTDQSDGYAVVRVSGPKARDVLAKGIPIDLHPGMFGTEDVASTQVAYMGIVLWQVDDAPTFEIALFRSFAGSFSHWLTESAAEFL